MTALHARRVGKGRRAARALVLGLLLAGPAAAADPAPALLLSAEGRLQFGSVWRLQAPDARLPFAVNAAAAGQLAYNGSGANADDGNLNFRRHQAVSRALTARLELSVEYQQSRAHLGLKAWQDFALRDDARPWGNAANGYAAGQPLADRGAPPLSRFTGLVIGDAWVEQGAQAGRWQLLARAGRQQLDWGRGSGFGGGLEALSPRDLPASRRAGASAGDSRLALPLLFGRAALDTGVLLEGYYQTRFQPSAIDMCGSFYAVNDYLVDGCDKVMGGAPALDDRSRVALGAYLKRLPTPPADAGQFGLRLRWPLAAAGLDLSLYHARYTSRTAVPSLRSASRAGPAFIAGDPDGRNIAFFTEYPQGLRLEALTLSHRSGAYGELSYRPRQPLLFGPGDALPPFMSPSVPALLRADARAVAPGAVFHGYENYPMWQGQLGVQAPPAAARPGWALELVLKHVARLPDQALRRFGRSDVFGSGPVQGACTVTTPLPALQCSERGYVSRNALAWRGHLEQRLPPMLAGLSASAALDFVQDLRGWSADALINEGRRTARFSLRAEVRQRYLLELAWLPVWGGDYNATADRDVLALSCGLKF